MILTLIFGGVVAWLYWSAPKTLNELGSKAAVTAGVYEIEKAKFEEALGLFRRDQFAAAREFFAQADPEKRDAKTQFYIAYSFYRQGFGKVYNDDGLFRQGLESAQKAAGLNPDLRIDDPDLKLKTAAELKAELQQGIEKTADDLNPLKIFRERK
jgi:tetratricopeptide (TPR) repeat protein